MREFVWFARYLGNEVVHRLAGGKVHVIARGLEQALPWGQRTLVVGLNQQAPLHWPILLLLLLITIADVSSKLTTLFFWSPLQRNCLL